MTEQVCSTALCNRMIATLLKLGVRFYTNYQTGETFVSKSWFEGTNDEYRLGITAMVAPHLVCEAIANMDAKRKEGGQ